MAGNTQGEKRNGQKEYLRIGEVGRLTATKAFVLRYWETEFPMLQPVKSPRGQRLYRQQDIETVLEIKRLLYDEGFTIAGARRHLRAQNGNGSGTALRPAAAGSEQADPASRDGGLRAGSEAGKETRRTKSSAVRPGPADRSLRKLLSDLREELRAVLTLFERG